MQTRQIEIETNCGNSKALSTGQIWLVNELKRALEQGDIFKAQIIEVRLQNLGVNLECVYAQ